MLTDEKWQDQDDEYNRKNDCVIHKTTRSSKQRLCFPFKLIGLDWDYRDCNFVFCIENDLPIVKRDGHRLIGPHFTFQQDGARPHTSQATIYRGT